LQRKNLPPKKPVVYCRLTGICMDGGFLYEAYPAAATRMQKRIKNHGADFLNYKKRLSLCRASSYYMILISRSSF
jgi:hypothetical protein